MPWGGVLLQHASLLHHGHEELEILTAASAAKGQQLKSVVRKLVNKPRPAGGDGAAAPTAGEIAAAEEGGYFEKAGKALRGWLSDRSLRAVGSEPV